MVPDKFDMVDMGGIDLIESQGVAVEGLYQRLVESITLCRYQCLYNWKFNGILIPPSYVEMVVRDGSVWINEGVSVDEDDVVHIYSIEPEPPSPILPEIEPLTVTENGEYYAPVGVDGYNPVNVNVPSQVVMNFTNSMHAESEEQITDVSGFTFLFNSSVPFGSSGTKVSTRLGITDEAAISSLQAGGWNANGMAFYDSENQIGAYGGYNFGEQLFITKVKLWLGRYQAQNTSLNVSVEYLDQDNVWTEIESLVIATSLPYPSNVFTVSVDRNINGIRWIHKNPPNKSGGNNITFAGMSVYKATGELIPCFKPQQGFNAIPEGYSGFGPIYVQ